MSCFGLRWRGLLLLLPWWAWACSSGEDRAAADLTIPVVVEKVKRSAIAATVIATGTLRAQREERVVAEVEGVLRLHPNRGVPLAAGQQVQAGQLLAEIENDEYLLGVRVESQKLAWENAERELRKQEALQKEGGVTEKELEIARRAALDARLNHETAVLKAQKLQLRAPLAGYVANLQALAADTRVPMGFRLCSIVDYRTVLLQVSLPNADLGRVRPGLEAKISNYALPDETFSGRITALDPTIDPVTRTFAVTLVVDNPRLLLRPGMFVKAEIIIENHEQAIVIPKAALHLREGRPVAFVVEGASAALREVTTGIETRDEVEILEGLAEDERLVVKGQETLRDKSKVRVTE